MYKDTSSTNSIDFDDELQLVVEVGHIASHIRTLEERFPSCFANLDNYGEDDEDADDDNSSVGEDTTVIDRRKDSGGGGGQTGLGTVIECKKTKKLQKQNGTYCNDDSSTIVGETQNRRRHKSSIDIKRKQFIEDLLIRIYEEHTRIRDIQSIGAEDLFRMNNTTQSPQKKYDEITDGTSSSSSSTTATAATTVAALPASPTGTLVTKNSNQCGGTSTTASSSGCSNGGHQIRSDSNSETGEIGVSETSVIGGSIGDIASKSDSPDRHNGVVVVVGEVVKKNESSSGDVGVSNVDLDLTNKSIVTTTIATTTHAITISTTSNTNCSALQLTAISANHLNQLATAFKLCDEDLRSIVKDLKNKVEYSEKMNWMCLSRRPKTPPHRKTSLPKHTEVKKRFLEICDNTLPDEIKAALRLPAFDSYEWDDADVIHLMQTMFMELGLIDKFNIPIETLREWLYEVYKHYNEVPFHNFRHCFCVAQMMYAITQQANLIQRLGELEVLILLVSCICHDLDHPGYNNIYQINARTELALRYNDISPLENHHCSIAFRLLEHPDCNIFKNFNRETFNFIREGIIRCILATDMARHNEILTQFKDVSPVFDYSNRAHVNLLCMVLIKVADISNEARPMDVAEPWLDRLLQEFFAQSAAEKSEGLPVTPFMDPDKVTKPGSQVRFIGLVLLPLFEALGDLLPDLIDLIIVPVRVALDYYKKLNDAQTKPRKSVAENTENSSDGGGSPSLPRSQSGISVRSRRSIPSQKSASRTSVDEPTCLAAELHDLPEGSESGDSETATEVDVAEKTSKFKVDTECCNRSKSSHSASRKSSREKRPSMISEMCSSGGGRMRNSYGNIHGYHSNRCHFGSNRAVSLDQYSSSNNRRLSDGLQQVISDSNVFYHRHLRSLDNDGVQGSIPGSGGAINNANMLATEKPKMAVASILSGIGGNGIGCGDDTLNMNLANALYDSNNSNNRQGPATIPTNNKNGSNMSGLGNGSSSQNGTAKSWKQRFKQITEMFSFSFDKSSKRFNSPSVRSSPCSIRNNNATGTELQKPGICCTISNNMSPSLLKRNPDLINAGRNRAYSLDVPARNRYSSSSGGGDSRKSSRNEDNSINRHDPFAEDNNSNHTSSGGGDCSLAPPHIRIGSDSTEPIAQLAAAGNCGGCDVSITGSITDSRPKI